MMKKVVGIIIMTCLIQSCALVGPRVFHAPLLSEKGEKHATLVGSAVGGVEAQFDIAISDKYFLMTDASYFKIQNFSSSAGSAGFGRYKRFGEHGVFSLYGGGSVGGFGNSKGFSNRSHFLLPYAGSNLGFVSRNFETAWTVRLSQNAYWDDRWRSQLNYTAWETALTMRAGGEKVKFHLQFGLSYPFDNSGLGTVMLSSGLTYRWKKK